jgi:DNA-directed RNA polymerase subunit RPC12/RpoP
MSGDTRICSRCGIEKPLDKDHYQIVKAFKSGFSYYCNDCSKEMKKVGAQNK